MKKSSASQDSSSREKKDPLVFIIQPGGMSTDTSLVTQPEGTTRFVLNGVNETNEGDLGFIAVEESNEACYTLPAGYIPLGEVYIGSQETLIFLCSSSGNSIIGIADRECNFTILVDDAEQDSKLGFKVTQQIEATYRLRRGCERTIYWIDPRPRTLILEKLEEFKDTTTGEWDFTKFNLFKTYSRIPNIKNIDVINAGGIIPAGSYNFSIQYLDENLNPTEFIISSSTVNVYEDDLELPFTEVEGSSSLESSYYLPVTTTKSIRLTLENLDTNYPFYRIAIIEGNGGTGIVTDTKVTEPIAINVTTFTYTGLNYSSSITSEEVTAFNATIESAKSITQLENKLTLADVAGSPINLCALQKYASKIKADCVLKTVVLNELQGANSKNPEATFAGLGYMPGEIYSFGVVWVFADGTLSPAYHIPGKSSTVSALTTFNTNKPGETYYPMSNDNVSETNMYTDNNTCESGDYWGADSEGDFLLNTPVRHHRFPLRSAIGQPLYSTDLLSSVDTELYAIRVQISGPLEIPAPCITDTSDPDYDPTCVDLSEDNQDILLGFKFTLNGEEQDTDFNITYDTWDPDATIGQQEYLGPFLDYQPIILSTSLIQRDKNEVETTVTLTESPVGTWTGYSSSTKLTYKFIIEPWVDNQEKKLYSTQALGINFSGIVKPDLVDTNGVEVVGYYIVRQDRTEEEKTILDSGILLPTLQNKHFVSHGLLLPDLPSNTDSRIKKDVLALVNPEFKFNNRIYTNFTSVLLEGKYNQNRVEYSRSITTNVLDGTTYNSKRHKKSERDSDGWDLQIRNRDSELLFESQSGVLFDQADIKDTFYLDALSYKTIKDSSEISKDVYNISCDNKVGIISLEEDYTGPIVTSLPYVLLKRDNANPYSNFRTTSFYKESKDVHYFVDDVTPSESSIYNGDSYVSSMKYLSSVLYENRARKRRTKRGILSIILGALIIIGGVALAIFTGGTSLAGAIALASAIGSAAVAGGGLLAASGIKQESWNKVYNDLYDKGLKETLEDDFLKTWYKDVNPSDDEIRWFGDALTNVWFESGVNIGLRQSANYGSIPSFIPSPAFVETGNGVNGAKTPSTDLDRHLLQKLTVLNADRSGSAKEYVGLALPELYDINPDFYRRNKQKVFNHLGLEYDCCSDCFEKFPTRVMYSEQAFQEELTDNFRIFLPNNYIDIEGETGRIVDMFRIQANLYLHTEEALWHLPQNFQERVTGDIVSFIGSGEYFNIPPRKIVDGFDSSAGTSHKWGRTKTKNGILFPCHREGKWYLFNGQDLKPISDAMMSTEIKKGMRFLIEEEYYKSTGNQYQFSDNPSNILGTGYLSVYDTKKERLLMTKKDVSITNLPVSDYQLCTAGTSVTIFTDLSQKIATEEALGYSYRGVENCKLKFTKEVLTSVTETRQVQVTAAVPLDTIIIPFFDTTSMAASDITNISNTIDAWFPAFKASVEGGNNNITLVNPGTWNKWGTERWVQDPAQLILTNVGINKDILLLCFVDETNASYHGNYVSNPMSSPTATYIADANNFVDNLHAQFKSFKAINYPIVQNNTTDKEYLQHAIAAIEAKNMTQLEIDALVKNPLLKEAEWAIIKNNLLTNPYVGQPILKNYGWLYKENRVTGVDQNGSSECPVDGVSVITPCTFTNDIDELLVGGGTTTIWVEQEVTVQIPTTEVKYVEGVPFTPITIDNSSTLSYSLKFNTWTSYHSYLPHFYFSVQDKFYSWKNGLTSLYRHNKKGSYRTFYGVQYPFIIEVVDNPQIIASKLTDGYLFQTEARKYDIASEEFYDMGTVTFNKVLAYNTRQISGWKNLVLKAEEVDYLLDQTKNELGNVLIDRNERDWTINELRDYSSNLNVPLFKKDLVSLQANYFIDKVVNPAAVNESKDWTQLESFRDKFLVIRLVFDTFTDVNLLMNFISGDKKNSER